jgi:hypothetical protein
MSNLIIPIAEPTQDVVVEVKPVDMKSISVNWQIVNSIFSTLLEQGWVQSGSKESGSTSDAERRITTSFTKENYVAVMAITVQANDQIRPNVFNLYNCFAESIFYQDFHGNADELSPLFNAGKAQEILYVIKNFKGNIPENAPTDGLEAKNYILSSVDEYAKVFSDAQYIWYRYVVETKKSLTNKAGTKKTVLQKGSKFGLRRATSNKDLYRLVVPELGKTIVFSLTEKMAHELIKKSVVTKA